MCTTSICEPTHVSPVVSVVSFWLVHRMTIENIEVMKEKMHTMERRVKKYEELQDTVARLQVENEVQYSVDYVSVTAFTVLRWLRNYFNLFYLVV